MLFCCLNSGFMDSKEQVIICYMITFLTSNKRVLLHGELYDWGAVSIGVPQGSILSPLLFALSVNDLPAVVQYSVLDLYVDDAELDQTWGLWRSACSLIWIMLLIRH